MQVHSRALLKFQTGLQEPESSRFVSSFAIHLSVHVSMLMFIQEIHVELLLFCQHCDRL